MHEPITTFPPGKVVGSIRLVKSDQVVDVTRVRFGTRTFFVEKVTSQGTHGSRLTAFRKTDDFPAPKIADRYIEQWLSGIVDNRGYKIIHEDPKLRTVVSTQETATA